MPHCFVFSCPLAAQTNVYKSHVLFRRLSCLTAKDQESYRALCVLVHSVECEIIDMR